MFAFAKTFCIGTCADSSLSQINSVTKAEYFSPSVPRDGRRRRSYAGVKAQRLQQQFKFQLWRGSSCRVNADFIV